MKDMTGIGKVTERVKQMEDAFDTLRRAAEKGETLPAAALQQLIRYYESGLWLRDYELDEQGLLPGDMKRGVLAQDALYDFLESIVCAK